MSRNRKTKRQLARARAVTSVKKAGGKIGRTQKLHRKMQVYPKTDYHGPGKSRMP